MSEQLQSWYVIGHRNPDTDAICAAIGHAAFLRTTGHPEVEAARCGELMERTRFVLERAGIGQPKLLTNVRPTAGSICRREVVEVSEVDTFMEAYRLMVDHGVRAVPVVNEAGEVTGILRYLDLLQLLLPTTAEGPAARTIHASLENIAKTLDGEMPSMAGSDGVEEELILMVGASRQDSVGTRLQRATGEGLVSQYVVICGNRPGVHDHALHYGARALIVTGGYGVEPQLVEAAREKGMTIILSPHDTAMTVKLALCARQLSHVLKDGFEIIEESQAVSRLAQRLVTVSQDLFPVVKDGTRRLVGVFSKSDLIDPPRMRLSLVDHNEFSQAVVGVEEAEVTEIIDHHRLSGDIISHEPVRFLNEPVGSSSTIIAGRFREKDLVPDPGVALCLAAGLISDTLNLTSPTTTGVDREILAWLAEAAGVDADEFARDFFEEGSLLLHGTPEAIIGSDRKEFSEQEKTVSLSQIEELSLVAFAERREELEAALHTMCEQSGFSLVGLLVTDVRSHDSVFLAVGEEALLEAFDFVRQDKALFDAPGVVSRKKQLFPAVCRAISKARQ